jgi:hypothetical protein
MNRSSRRAHAAKKPGLWSHARRLLAGQPSSAGLQLFLGPNGGLIWTDAAKVDRSEPYADAVLSIPEKSAAHIHGQSQAALRPKEPAIPLYNPVEASVQN